MVKVECVYERNGDEKSLDPVSLSFQSNDLRCCTSYYNYSIILLLGDKLKDSAHHPNAGA
jgi:hypothetical protein